MPKDNDGYRQSGQLRRAVEPLQPLTGLKVSGMSAEMILAIVGAVGLTTLGNWIARGRLLGRRHGLLRFHFGTPIDIVLGTSAVFRRDDTYGYTRLLTSFGNLEAATTFARVIGERGGRNDTRIQLSEAIGTRLDDDLVLLGGPRRSDAARRFLHYLAAEYPELDLSVGDNTPAACWLSVGGFRVRYEPVDQEAHPGYPTEDYALVVAWLNPFTVVKRRAFLCAGFSSHGTRAATNYLLTDFIDHRRRRWRSVDSTTLSQRPRRSRVARAAFDWPCFVMVLHLILDGDEAVDVKEVAFVPLDLPSVPLSSVPTRVEGQPSVGGAGSDQPEEVRSARTTEDQPPGDAPSPRAAHRQGGLEQEAPGESLSAREEERPGGAKSGSPQAGRRTTVRPS
jgi:hypothetical protein